MAVRGAQGRRTFDILDEHELAQVREATTTVLSTVGLEVRSASVLKELGTKGAQIDEVAGRVRFAPEQFAELIALAPSKLHFGARDARNDLSLDGATTYLGIDGCAAEVLDWQTGVRRPSSNADVATITRIADALPQLSYLWQPVTARDEHELSSPVHEVLTQWRNSTKHVMQMTAVHAEQARALVEMVTALQGSSEQVRTRPALSAFQCSISPLTYEAGALEAAAVYGAAGIPCGYMVMPITAATAPTAVAGTLVLGNAEVLGGIAIGQLLHPGAPTFYGSCATMMDMRSGAATCGGPEDFFYQAAHAQLARSYGIPSNIGTFATGSKASDFQAGAENAASGMASLLGRADMCAGAGLLYAARVFSPVQMVLDADLFELLARFAEGYEFDAEHLALEVIAAVGPGGHFLAEQHTRDHMRDFYAPAYFDRQMWEEWEAAKKPGPRDMAREKIRTILDTHEPTPLPDDVDAACRAIVASLDESVRLSDPGD